MRHRKKTIKLGRTKSHREAMLSNMAVSILTYYQIKTTDAKAKAVKRVVDKLVTWAKKGDLSARRHAYGIIRDRKLVKKLFDEIAPQLEERKGGYTRVLKLGIRAGDGASVSVVELMVEKPVKEKQKKKKKRGKEIVAEEKKEPKTKKAKEVGKTEEKEEESEGAKPAEQLEEEIKEETENKSEEEDQTERK